MSLLTGLAVVSAHLTSCTQAEWYPNLLSLYTERKTLKTFVPFCKFSHTFSKAYLNSFIPIIYKSFKVWKIGFNLKVFIPELVHSGQRQFARLNSSSNRNSSSPLRDDTSGFRVFKSTKEEPLKKSLAEFKGGRFEIDDLFYLQKMVVIIVFFYIIFSKINRKIEQVWTDTSLFTYFQFQNILETHLINEKNCFFISERCQRF